MHDVTKQVQPMLVHATQVALAQRHAVAIEELEDLDGDLAAVVQSIPEFRGVEPPRL
ncbi:hypothetical protein [Hyphomicrobium sp.]|uniref:hypothetical protein n=1 Tax=Hyphomicrobium sp. TaxID=82 RepID=UPI0025B90E47|nr:hypothetical protein [Hyphomicrobium sp.]